MVVHAQVLEELCKRYNEMKGGYETADAIVSLQGKQIGERALVYVVKLAFILSKEIGLTTSQFLQE